MATRGFHDFTSIAVASHRDDILVIHVFEDRNFIVDREDGVIVASQKLLLQNFESHELSCASAAAHIHFGSVSFAERFDDIVLVVENGVLGA